MSTELDVSQLRKEDSVFGKTTIISFTFLQERKESYILIQMEHAIPFEQLLVKEMGHGDFMVPQGSLLLSWPLLNYLSLSYV